MKTLAKGFIALATALVALSASSNAQSLVFGGAGSSALFLELGQAASQAPASPYYPEACVWSSNSSTLTDNSTYGAGVTETGNKVWITWSAGSTGTCASPAGTGIYVSYYVSADSVVGNRVLFNHAKLTALGSGGANVLGTGTDTVTTLPTAISNVVLNSTVTAAGTDIRPEDAEFAITRALTTYNTPVVAGSQYLGLGYTNGNTIPSDYSGSYFNVINFALPTSFTVTPVGAAPIVVAVNSTDASGTGFHSSNITNLNSSTLALYLDGTIGETQDALTPGTSETASEPVTVVVREPLSGTYNTMEYNVPNTLALQTSQDVGLTQLTSQKNNNPTAALHIANATGNGGYRRRAIGTGQELSEVFATNDALGYGFWSVSNFKAAPATAKYLTVDGVDPIEANYNTNGAIPTPTSGVGPSLSNVTFTHVLDGTYPIWSLLRLVDLGSAPGASYLGAAAQAFSTTSYPDFVPYSSLAVERSHFTPPGQTVSPQNAYLPRYTEAGGDVGGVVIPTLVDQDYASATGNTAGFTGHRR